MVTLPQDLLSGIIKDPKPILRDKLHELITALSKPEKLVKKKESTNSKGIISVLGTDYSEAVDKMNNLFLMNRWGDGLPLLPASSERVECLLTGTDRKR